MNRIRSVGRRLCGFGRFRSLGFRGLGFREPLNELDTQKGSQLHSEEASRTPTIPASPYCKAL